MPQELLGVNPGWVEGILDLLSGDLSYDRIAHVKQVLKGGLDCQRFIRQDGVDARGCLFSGTGRGDCEHYVGLPGKSIPGAHDGKDDTIDEYGRPNGWCEVCWRGRQITFLEMTLFNFAKEYGNGYARDTVEFALNKATHNGILTKDDIKQLSPPAKSYTAYVIEAVKLRSRTDEPVYLSNQTKTDGVWIWTSDIL